MFIGKYLDEKGRTVTCKYMFMEWLHFDLRTSIILFTYLCLCIFVHCIVCRVSNNCNVLFSSTAMVRRVSG